MKLVLTTPGVVTPSRSKGKPLLSVIKKVTRILKSLPMRGPLDRELQAGPHETDLALVEIIAQLMLVKLGSLLRVPSGTAPDWDGYPDKEQEEECTDNDYPA